MQPVSGAALENGAYDHPMLLAATSLKDAVSPKDAVAGARQPD